MKNARAVSLSLALWAFTSLAALAQNAPQEPEGPKSVHVESFLKRLVIGGEVRTRFEFRDPIGYANPVQINGSQDFLHVRVRLDLDAQVTDHVRAFVQIQDQRFAGGEPPGGPGSGNPLLPFSTAFGDAKNTDVHQAFFEIQDCWGEDLDFKGGRFTMCYGSRRFL
jgi:hypothetical protein